MMISSDGEASTMFWGSQQGGRDPILVAQLVKQAPGSPTQAHQSWEPSIAESPHHARPTSALPTLRGSSS